MASTDAKSGFRLPWSTDRTDSEEQAGTAEGDAASAGPQSESETPTMIETAPTHANDVGQDEPAAPAGSAAATPSAGPRKANKFMADLTKAMQAAAEAARADTLERFTAEAKAHIESIHASTADASTALRKKADDDIAEIREWSKTEIARVRDETDERVTHRKEKLEREIEAHAAEIEARIDRVQSRVSAFEGQMAAFFEKLLGEEDPTRFAAMAETLPEPPPFDADSGWTDVSPADPTPSLPESPVAEASVAADWGAPAPTDDPVESPAVDAEPVAIEAEQTQTADVPAEDVPTETAADGGDLFGLAAEDGGASEGDPRLAALGIENDFAAAEAEAAEFPVESPTPDEEIPTIPEDALAARLAGLVSEEHSEATGVATTRVIVTGLVSVASIAGFKRSLARVAGVRSVGVSSGPDGEFVFAVTHDPEMRLVDGIATLPGFAARVTNEAPGELTVAARDPESEG